MKSAIAIVAPDGNRIVGLSMEGPLADLRKAKPGDPRVTRNPNVDTAGDWPFRFDLIYVATRSRWRSYRPDDLPMKYW